MPSSTAVAALETLNAYSTPLVWVAMLAFLAGAVLEVTDRREFAVPFAAVGWVTFGVFWLAMFPYFYWEFGSPLEGLLSLLALPLCLYAAYLLVGGRDRLLVVSRAVACMGLIYLPVMTIQPIEQWLIETVAGQTAWVMGLLGYEVPLEIGRNGYRSRLATNVHTPPDQQYATYIVLACTGIGSISIFGGLVASVRAPLRRKLAGVAAATGIIYTLNIGRNVFVGLAAPLGWFDYPALEWLAVTVAGEGVRTSFFVAHHLIAQTGAVIALVGITLLVVRIVPEVVEPLEEVLFVLTGTEYDLEAALASDAGGDAAPGDDAGAGGDPDATGDAVGDPSPRATDGGRD